MCIKLVFVKNEKGREGKRVILPERRQGINRVKDRI
jgi:hypothetical protein